MQVFENIILNLLENPTLILAFSLKITKMYNKPMDDEHLNK